MAVQGMFSDGWASELELKYTVCKRDGAVRYGTKERTFTVRASWLL